MRIVIPGTNPSHDIISSTEPKAPAGPVTLNSYPLACARALFRPPMPLLLVAFR